MSKESKIKKHLINLLNALTNLSPSRNLISQLSLQLPKKLTTIEHSYPELATQTAKKILEILGIKFKDIVERKEGSFSEALYQYIHKTFDWLDDELICKGWDPSIKDYVIKKLEVRSELAKLLNVDLRALPNPYAEWASLVLRKFSSEPMGKKVINFLKMLLKHDSIRFYDSERMGVSEWDEFKNEVIRRLKINPAEFEELSRKFVNNPLLGKEELYYTGSRRYMVSQAFLLHSDYHLDLIYEVTHYYYYISRYGKESSTFVLRHKETLKKVLEEFKL